MSAFWNLFPQLTALNLNLKQQLLTTNQNIFGTEPRSWNYKFDIVPDKLQYFLASCASYNHQFHALTSIIGFDKSRQLSKFDNKGLFKVKLT